MSSKKPSSKQDDKRIKRDLKKLRDMGLLTKRVDLRKRPTSYQKGMVTKFADVLKGKAKVFTAKDKASARRFKNSYVVRDDKIIVPREKGERITFDPDANELKSTRTYRGRKLTRVIASGDLALLGKGEYYVVPFAGGQRFRTNDLKLLLEFMKEYEQRSRPYTNWRAYVEIETLEDEDDTISISSYRRKRKSKSKRSKKRGR